MKTLNFLYDAFYDDKCIEDFISLDLSDENAELVLKAFDLFNDIDKIIRTANKLMYEKKIFSYKYRYDFRGG